MRKRRRTLPGGTGVYIVIVLAILFSASIAYYVKTSSSFDDRTTITLYGFSVKGEVFDSEIIPAFERHWFETEEEVVNFETVYEGSGSITKKVLAGAPAEIMVLSTEWDALALKEGGMVTTDWNDFPYRGVLSKSPWVILARDGNPRGIADFDDLTRDGMELVHADPLTSGGACWSVFAVYGSVLKTTEVVDGTADQAAARERLEGVVGNVISWQSSARKALSQFALGYGDAFITYESEALFALEDGQDCEIVYPSCTIYSEHKVVLVDENIDPGERRILEAFLDFLYTPEVQGYLADYGFRSVEEAINLEHDEFPDIVLPFTVDYLGGWETAHAEIIEGVYGDIRG